ncbi:MAG: glycosyltransferase family 4 protein [Actinomycetota bacterium]|nr:glycosyltransferase family 4 protein [Actinomycetota bacterium]
MPARLQHVDDPAAAGNGFAVAFFDFADVFEDFYPRFGVDQAAFARTWRGSGNHAWLSLIQKELGTVSWYVLSLAPEVTPTTHDSGVRVTFVRSSRVHRWLWHLQYTSRHSWRLRRFYRAYATVASYAAPLSLSLVRALRKGGCDLILVQDYSSGRFDVLYALARLLRKPLVAYHSGSTPADVVGRTARRWTLPRADHLILSSARERASLERRFRLRPAKTSVVLTPVDTGSFRPLDRDRALASLGLPADRRYLLFAGRLDDRVKRVSALVRAFASVAADHDDARLLVAGDGPDRGTLRDLAHELTGDKVVFLDWVEDSDALVALYNAADALVLPSLREGFPTVVGEAISCGLPVIASDVGGASELVVPGRTGSLIPGGDERALADALADVLEHRAHWAGMRAHARALAEERVAEPVVAAQLRSIFSGVTERRP